MKKPERVYLYSVYERCWHWLQALSIVILLLTGVEIHLPSTVHLFGFELATKVHEAFAIFTISNAFLSLFYHLATGAIRQFLPEPRDFWSLALEQLRYYTHGMFANAPHPVERSPDHKLNVLQQVTYLAILNVLLPLQVVTGLLMWRGDRLGGTLSRLGGIPAIASVHAFGAWLFAAFLILHVYLTTTGKTPLAHIRSMIVGWEAAPAPGAETKTETRA